MCCLNWREKLQMFEEKLGFKNKIKWPSCVSIIAYHLLAVVWCYHYTFPAKWQTMVFAFVLYMVTGFGITGGVHRYWTHRSYKAKYPLRLILLICYSTAGLSSVIQWVRDHRLHHKYSDTDADPHNAKRGLFFSHIGWLMMKKSDLVIEKGKEIDISDLHSDPLIRFQDKHFGLIKLVFCYLIPTMTGILLWNEEWKCAVAWQCFIRYLIVLHATLSVNSFAHAIGNRPFNRKILPTQCWISSVLTLGEGWHNFHHTFPYDYRASETIDFLTWMTGFIHFFAMLGWAYDLKQATPELIRSTAEKNGDGSLVRFRNLKKI